MAPEALARVTIMDDPFQLVVQPEVDIVVELIGGCTPARELVLQAIAQGKHVVTANKALIALHGNEIFAAAQQQGVTVAFEAAVAGGIPIIKAVREGLAANHIEWMAGIINGTGNFILTEMRDKGRDFAEVLQEAQALGYAEADPTFDVEGVDAAHKLTILAALAFGIPLQFSACYTEGIGQVQQQDVSNAARLGYRIKQLAFTRKTAQGIELRVHPTLIPEKCLLANVDGVMNAVLAQGDMVGQTLHYGAGAGALPTASSVVADIIEVARTLTTDPHNRVPHLAFQPSELADIPVLPMAAVTTAYYLRLTAQNKPGVLAAVTAILGEAGISIEAVSQQEPAAEICQVPLVLLTHPVQEQQMNAALAKISDLPDIADDIVRLRVESLD
jgi:homoserine dehydrogenase